MASVVHRGADGSVIYKAANHMDIPNLDLLTALFGESSSPIAPCTVLAVTLHST